VELPEPPGVYFLLDKAGSLVYLGKASNLRRRVRDHSRSDLERTIAMTTNTPTGDVDRPSDRPVLERLSAISYLHIPATDLRRSAAFYHDVFDWELRSDPEHPSFADGSAHVVGTWVTDRSASEDTGLLPYIYVDDVDEILDRVRANSCEIVRQPYPEGNLAVATFRDPAGNVVGIWQHGPRRRQT